VTIVYLSQLMLETGKLADPHPGYQAVEMVAPAVGAAVTTDAARTEKRREVSMPSAIKNVRGRPGRPGLGKVRRGEHRYKYGVGGVVTGGRPSLQRGGRVSHAA